MLLLKLEFLKAYDIVSSSFLIQCMQCLRFLPKFINLVTMLLQNAETSANLASDSGESLSFPIRRGVRQGCPLAPYLFLVVGEALNSAMKEVVRAGELVGITLPKNAGEQIIFQYADDTNFTILAEETNFTCLNFVITCFGLASSLWPNWNKSLLFWVANRAPPSWLDSLGCPWVAEWHLAKMLGTPFGIRMDTADIDVFLL
jgi:hypothetical protein